jgi:RimJ/RimL family protein N-acetyltransferase
MPESAFPKRYRLSLDIRLGDGTPIYVRTLRPRDRIQLARGFERLSAQSRRFRFLAPLRRLTSRQLSMLTDVDQVNHVAIGARDNSRSGHPGVAVARFIRFEQEPAIAEFALTVVDEYQHKGLGTQLLRLLLDAAQKLGVQTLRGYVLPDNVAMIRLLDTLGATWSRAWGSVLTADLAVFGQVPTAEKASTTAGSAFEK